MVEVEIFRICKHQEMLYIFLCKSESRASLDDPNPVNIGVSSHTKSTVSYNNI